MLETLQLSALQVDALREVANIASGHAATALSQLTERRIMIAVPEFTVATAEELPGILGYRDQPVVVVAMHVLGDMTGSFVFLIPEPQAARLSALLLRRSGPAGDVLDTLAKSSLTETANIIGGAYAGALGTLLGCVVMLSVPAFGIEPPGGVLQKLRATEPEGRVGLCIETRLTLEGAEGDFGGHILLLPNRRALYAILEGLQVRR